jgi:hypothetical protein
MSTAKCSHCHEANRLSISLTKAYGSGHSGVRRASQAPHFPLAAGGPLARTLLYTLVAGKDVPVRH